MVDEESDTSLFWGLLPVEQLENEWHLENCDYTCTLESITVPAGDFDVYTVEAEFHYGEEGLDYFYTSYAEDVGNVVKCSVNIDFETEVTYYNMELELISTTYET